MNIGISLTIVKNMELTILSDVFLKEHILSTSSNIRLESYKLLETLIKNKNLNENLKLISIYVIGSINEKDAQCLSALWSLLLKFLEVIF